MTSAITFSGLGSGIDMASIVEALVDTERQRRIEPFENWKTEWTAKISAFQTLNVKLSSLHIIIKSMDTPAEFLVKTASSSNEDVLTASASSTALNGSYTFDVGSTVQHRLASDGKQDQDTTDYADNNDWISLRVGTSTESFQITDPIPLTPSFTLEDVATEINTHSSLVTAEVVDDGSSSNQYRLVLTAVNGGTSNRIFVETNDTDVDFSMSGSGDRIDAAEGSLNGTATVTSGGQYSGTTNKTFEFTVSGSSIYTVGTDTFDVNWIDSTGNSGTISVSSTNAVDVFQGLTIQFSAGTVQGGDTFSVNVWHPDIQNPQDDGLAKAEKEIHSGFSDEKTTAITTSDATFTYNYQGQERQIDVSAGTTLSGLADLINNDSQNPGITASILNDGSGLTTAHHLMLSGNSTGADYKIENISHTLDQFSGNGLAGGDFSETQSAQNAMIKVDGYPPDDDYIQRSSNTIGDVISGLTLSLVGTGSTTVTVNTDTEAIKQNITDFVNTFNEVRKHIKELTGYDPNTNEAGILLGNYAVDTIKNRLNGIVSSIPPGFRDGYETYINLMQIGIYTDAETGSATQGELIIDDAILDSALASNQQAVAEFFSEYFSGRSVHESLDYQSHIPGITEAGTFEISFNHSNPSQSQMRLKGGEWHTVETWDGVNHTLTGASGTPASGLLVRVTDTSSSFVGEVDLKLGFASNLKEELDFLINSNNGPLAVLEKNYQDIIDNIDRRIELEEKRIALYEQRLKERYARLEDVLTELNGQSSYISARLEQLSQ
jgi:flagellar hook-associated protein 2